MNAGVAIVVGLVMVIIALWTMDTKADGDGSGNLPRTALILFGGIVLFGIGIVLAFVG